MQIHLHAVTDCLRGSDQLLVSMVTFLGASSVKYWVTVLNTRPYNLLSVSNIHIQSSTGSKDLLGEEF